MGDPLLNDVYRPLDTNQIKKGWHTPPQEYDYWVPEEDIEGTLPTELNGTLFRNGPGLHEVYGKKLLHGLHIIYVYSISHLFEQLLMGMG